MSWLRKIGLALSRQILIWLGALAVAVVVALPAAAQEVRPA